MAFWMVALDFSGSLLVELARGLVTREEEGLMVLFLPLLLFFWFLLLFSVRLRKNEGIPQGMMVLPHLLGSD